MAITTRKLGSIAKTPYLEVSSGFTGSLSNFIYTMGTLVPDSKYLWGYSFDVQSGSGRGGLSWNGNASADDMVYGPGYGSFKKFQGSAIHWSDSTGKAVIRGVEYANTLNVRGAMKLFFIRIE